MISRSRRLILAAGVAGAAWMAIPAWVGASVDAPQDAGSVQFIDPDTRQQLFSGDSNTVFTLAVPEGGMCPGDSANDDWRIQSFLVPVDDDPGALRYGVIRADGDGRFAVYTQQTRPHVHALTEQNPAPGLPARIPVSPPLSFGVFPAGTLTEDTYRIGIACTLFRETAVFWDAEISLTAAPDVQPGQFRWEVLGESPAEQPGGGSSAVWLLPATAGVGVLLFVAVRGRRRERKSPPSTPTKEFA